MTTIDMTPATATTTTPATQAVAVQDSRKVAAKLDVSYIPKVDPLFLAWGNYKVIEEIVQSGIFFPTYITGLSGNGKTANIDQVCANLKREFIRVNITEETDDDDLLGGYRLEGGDTVWQDGPVVEAMTRGAVLLLDEVDLGSNKIMVLQSVLEGKKITIKKTGRVVEPKAGFTIFATGNTKGKGSDDGQFAGTNVLNEAFMDRFPIMIEQPYPAQSVEAKILEGVMTHYKKITKGEEINEMDINFINKLTLWTHRIRDAYKRGAIEDVMSTRRVIDITKSYCVFDDRQRAIEYGVTRFDETTSEAMLTFYKIVDEEATKKENAAKLAEGAEGAEPAPAPTASEEPQKDVLGLLKQLAAQQS